MPERLYIVQAQPPASTIPLRPETPASRTTQHNRRFTLPRSLSNMKPPEGNWNRIEWQTNSNCIRRSLHSCNYREVETTNKFLQAKQQFRIWHNEILWISVGSESASAWFVVGCVCGGFWIRQWARASLMFRDFTKRNYFVREGNWCRLQLSLKHHVTDVRAEDIPVDLVSQIRMTNRLKYNWWYGWTLDGEGMDLTISYVLLCKTYRRLR